MERATRRTRAAMRAAGEQPESPPPVLPDTPAKARKARVEAAAAAEAGAEGTGLAALLSMLAFGTGITLVMQLLANQGGSKPEAYVQPFVQYATDYGLGLLRGKQAGGGHRAKPSAATRAVTLAVPALDLVGCVSTFAGVRILGSGMYSAVFASLLVVTAVFSAVVLGKRFSLGQLAGMGLVTAAMAVMARSAVGGDAQIDPAGFAVTMCSVGAYALRTVFMEYVTLAPGGATGNQLASSIGVTGLCFFTLVMAFHTLPKAQELVFEPMRANKVTLGAFAALNVLFMVTRAGFTMSQLAVLSSWGAPGVSLVGAVRTATVSLSSAALFCSADNPNQCLNDEKKLVATLLVAGGVVYAFSKPPRAKAE